MSIFEDWHLGWKVKGKYEIFQLQFQSYFWEFILLFTEYKKKHLLKQKNLYQIIFFFSRLSLIKKKSKKEKTMTMSFRELSAHTLNTKENNHFIFSLRKRQIAFNFVTKTSLWQTNPRLHSFVTRADWHNTGPVSTLDYVSLMSRKYVWGSCQNVDNTVRSCHLAWDLVVALHGS